MNAVDPTRTLADLVSQAPGRARVLERHRLDYCCHGDQALDAACLDAGLDPGVVVGELSAAGSERPAWAGGGLPALLDHIESTHHPYLRAELPRLSGLFEKVVAVHGERHPELYDAQTTLGALRAELEPHLVREERVLFPVCRELSSATQPLPLPFGTVGNPIRCMEHEHEAAGALIEALRDETDDFAVPEDACGSYRALYEGLSELAADTHMHIHLENNVLFPAVVEREASLGPI